MPSVNESLTDQFYNWERYGRGWQVFDRPVTPEPPFVPFPGHFLPPQPTLDDGRRPTAISSFIRHLSSAFSDHSSSQTQRSSENADPEPVALHRSAPVELQVSLPRDLDPSRQVFSQCLRSACLALEPLSFELLGVHGNIGLQIALAHGDVQLVRNRLEAAYPSASFVPQDHVLTNAWHKCWDEAAIVEFGLAREFMLPLALSKLDPFVGMVGALSKLHQGELGLFQVLFQPVNHPWAESMVKAVTHAGERPFFINAPELAKAAQLKAGQPLYAAVIRIATRASSFDRAWVIARDMASALHVFSDPSGNELIPLRNDDYRYEAHQEDVLLRQCRRSGMILTLDELTGFVHLPSLDVPLLARERTKSKATPQSLTFGQGILLGHNIHGGITTEVHLSPDQRVRHMHIIGASGTGKSTLLLNLICQDIFDGNGLAVLDPHGDLVDKILSCIPPERYDDVILFDPSDELFPVGFNILSAHSNLEKNLLASDLVAVFRRLSTSWGDQMTSVLGNAILAVLESPKGGTLVDLRRFLAEPSFRNEFLTTVTDSEVLYYWKHEFPLLKSTNSVAPLLTRLNSFLRPKTIRYVVAQRENRLDFGSIMDGGKILLCPLAQGLIGEENAHLLGALLVAKIHQLAISRQEQQAGNRRLFLLYLDEFQHFATPTMATILSGVRKYNLGLVLAHHELRQIQKSDDLASAVMSHPYTRVCFRVGEEDARKLASGFFHFEAKDLQNLSTGEAIVRIERADFDFNLKTIAPPEVEEEDAKQRKAHLQSLTRQQYGWPREEVEKLLNESRSEPPTAPPNPIAKLPAKQRGESSVKVNADVPFEKMSQPIQAAPSSQLRVVQTFQASPGSTATKLKHDQSAQTPTEPAQQGRGGAIHKHLQEAVKRAAEDIGFRASIEAAIPDSCESIDVLLQKGDLRVACEISVTGTVHYEMGNAMKCLKAGYEHVAVISEDAQKLRNIQAAVLNSADTSQTARLGFYSTSGFIEWLRDHAARHTDTTSQDEVRRGYRIKRSSVHLTVEERKRREEAILNTIAEAMKKPSQT